MYKVRWKVFIILIIIVSAALLSEIVNIDKEKRINNITIITENKITESLITMKAGADKAAEEMNVDVRLITLSKDDLEEEQKELLLSENISKTDAILISPVNYDYLHETIEKINKNIPVVLLNSHKEKANKLNSIVFDNYDMGVKIGKEIINSSAEDNEKKVIILMNNLNNDMEKERCDGLISVLHDKIPYDVVNLKADRNNMYYDSVKRLITEKTGDIIVSFNEEILLSAAQAKSDILNINKDDDSIKIYGSGNTRKIISFLEKDIINGIIFENQFSIGYLGIKNAVNFIKNHKTESNVISSKVITRENMYSMENQRLLFLFIR